MLSNLPANHAKFFNTLDAELDKIETFYAEKEEEMHGRAKLLGKQLDELGKHRQLFHVGAPSLRLVDTALTTPLGIIRALEDSKLGQESVYLCLICAFANDPVVPKPQHEIRRDPSNKQERHLGV